MQCLAYTVNDDLYCLYLLFNFATVHSQIGLLESQLVNVI